MLLGSSTYSKGCLLESGKDWYHGLLSRAEAENVLKACGYDCFLIRESEGALVLSLIHHGQVHHVNINCRPGWYELESGGAQYSFTELEELVTHYHSNAISDQLKITLGLSCKKDTTAAHKPKTKSQHKDATSKEAHIYEAIDNRDVVRYTRGSTDLVGYGWFHGCMSEDQAEVALDTHRIHNNKFLVRHSDTNLILSKKINGWKSHTVIHRSPQGYRLEGREEVFESVPTLVAHYQQFSVDNQGGQLLGTGIDKCNFALGLPLRPTRSALFRKGRGILTIQWTRLPNLPVAISAPQVVASRRHIYVGGGLRKPTDVLDVFRYSLSREAWIKLPHCPTTYHSLAVLDSELVAIGGIVRGQATNAVLTFRDGEWQEILPRMPTARCLLSITSHDGKLITAGGTTLIKSSGERHQTDVVELLVRNEWYSTCPLPFPISTSSMKVVNDACYILGGNRTILHAKLVTLYDNATPAGSGTPGLQFPDAEAWEKLSGKHPLTFPTLVEIGGRLVTMGGSVDSEQRVGTKLISVYDFATHTWVECKGAELPLPLYRVHLEGLTSGKGKIVMAGGQKGSQNYSSAVFIGTHDLHNL